MVFSYEDGCISDPLSPIETIILSPRLSAFLKFKLYQLDVHSASLNRYLNEEVEDLILANIMRNVMENELSNNIDNVVNISVSVDEGSILMNKDVHDRSGPVNEGVTKDVDPGNMSLFNEDIMLKLLC